MLTLQPHTSHKMQPLDRTVFKALKASYNTAVDNFMRSNPGKRVTMFDVGELFGIAYNRITTPEKAIKGFEVTGLWPLNEMIFSEEDFAPSLMTDEADPSNNDHAEDVHETNDIPGPSGISGSTAEVVSSSPAINAPSNTGVPVSPRSLIEDLSPLPVAPKRKRTMKVEKSKVLTSSPSKKQLEDMKNKSAKRKVRVRSATPSKAPAPSYDRTSCFICSMKWVMSCEEWIQCTKCKRWACVPCTDVESADQIEYVCDFCRVL